MSTERDPIPGPGGLWPVPDRSLVPTVLGVRPWVAVGLAAALTALGVVVDLFREGTLGAVFTVCHVVGCLLAVAWVRRSGLFWTLVQPPLLVALAVPVVVLVASSPGSGVGLAERALTIGAPLVNAFPVMALATALVLAVGAFRMLNQRLPPASRRVSRPSGPAADGAPAAGRRSASPPRS